MKKWLQKRWNSEITRPLVYMIFTRGILALFAAQLVHFFVPKDWPLSQFRNLAALMAALFALGTLLAWLRMDGLKIPHLKLPRMKRKDPPFLQHDIADHVDEEIVSFEDLDPEDRDTCVFLADAVLTVVCLVLAIIL